MMTQESFVSLINNAALLLALGVLYDTIRLDPKLNTLIAKILTGLIIGIIGAVIMLTPWQFSPGVNFDTRSILLSLTGLFFGAITASITTLITVMLRLYQGGTGAWTGVGVQITSAAIGLFWRYYHHKLPKPELSDWLDLYIFGLIVHITMLLWMLTLPATISWQVLNAVTLPVITIYPVGTVLLGLLLNRQRDRKKQETATQESEGRVRRIVQAIPVPVVITRLSDHSVLYTNDAYRDFVGTSVIDLLELRKQKFVIDPNDWDDTIERFSNEEEQSVVTTNIERDDGNQSWIALSNQLLIFDGEQALFLAFQDITELRQAKVEQENLILELAAKNTELERFTYTVSHDLKSPLITIKGFLAYLERDATSGDVQRLRGDIKYISDAVDKMEQLLEELLKLSRIGRLVNPPEEISTNALINEVMSSIQGHLSGNNIQIDIEPDLPIIFGDRVRLGEVFENLLSNAIKHSKNQSNPRIEINSRSKDDKTIFYVQDNGIGIDPKYHDKVFNLFDQLDPSTEGTGIGLTIVKRIIEAHNGQIWVESDGNGKGTRFCFTLPNKNDALAQSL